ncbi:histidinol-phosphate transaminase [Alkalicoccus luteus]|uniref:Histidinol-phosphate aminotransferase n=1 Tax=Alkalicoccus luteus TaxID=1237094 RepID=A0A969TU00_9BACI|nr:histidinol-phosphate transaminase [Alkalicoccus luteus]NJP38198.1 histidinol-phosphate transaminase [Alkalicoccus luteus]
MQVKPSVRGLKPYQPGKTPEQVREELGLERVVKLASNENPYGASPEVAKAVTESLVNVAVYPDGAARALRKETASRLGVQDNQLLFGNGSDEVILILCRAVLEHGDNIVTAWPTFPQYRHNAVIEGAEVKEVPLQEGFHDLQAMASEVDSRTKIVFVCNPNNPSGTHTGADEFRAFMKQIPEDVIVVSDEAYKEYVDTDDYPDTLSMIDEYPNLLVLRTFSKAYGIASLRVGYGVGNVELIAAVEPGREPFNTNSAAQAGALAALKDVQFLDRCVSSNSAEKRKFEQFCEENGFHYYPSQANFILMSVDLPGGDVFDHLQRNGFIVRNGEALGFPRHVRITFGRPEDNDRIQEELLALRQEEAGVD